MLPTLQIGPLAIRLPGLLLLLGVWVGLWMAEKSAIRYRMPVNDLYNLVFASLVSGLVGARLFYALQHVKVFIDSPLSLVSLDSGLLDPLGGLLIGGITALAYLQKKNLSFWSSLDSLVPVLAVFQVSLGLANMASGDGFGAPTDLPWGIYLWGEVRHPTQVYETILAFIILTMLWFGHERLENLKPGGSFLTFIALSAAARLFIEAFRGDSTLILGGFRSAQVIAWLVLAVCLWGLGRTTGMPAADHPPRREQ